VSAVINWCSQVRSTKVVGFSNRVETLVDGRGVTFPGAGAFLQLINSIVRTTGVEMQFLSVELSSLRKTAIAVAAGAGLMVAASQSHAVIVYSGPVSLNIPVTTNGLYLNVVNGATNLPAGGAGTTVPGWDINPWSATGLAFFSPTAPAGGAYVLSGTSTVANLAVGTLISGTSTFGSGIAANTAQFNLNSSNNVFGFRFINEAGGTTHYGWARFALGASTIDPTRRVVEYAFESTPGLGIQAGVVPGPGTYALMGLGIAGVLLAARRRKQS
jgi:PEP-CTERM motif